MNISKELQKLLAKSIWEYPSLYKSGGMVLRHMLCSYGTGYEWINGELCYPEEWEYKDDLVDFETYCIHYPNFNLTEELLESKSKFAKDIYDEQMKFFRKSYDRSIKIRNESMERALDLTIEYPIDLCYYSPICRIPFKDNLTMDLTPMWQEAVKIMLRIINEKLWGDFDEHEYAKKQVEELR